MCLTKTLLRALTRKKGFAPKTRFFEGNIEIFLTETAHVWGKANGSDSHKLSGMIDDAAPRVELHAWKQPG